jgi:hypothetical protein
LGGDLVEINPQSLASVGAVPKEIPDLLDGISAI